MEVSYEVSLKEYSEASRLAFLNSTFSRKVNYCLARIVLPGAGSAAVLVAIVLMWQGRVGLSAGLILIGAAIVWILCPLFYTRKIRRYYGEQKIGRPTTLTASAEGVDTSVASGEAAGRFRWQAFEKHIESKNIFVLFVSPIVVITIPKRSMSAEQMEDLRVLLKENVTSIGR